MSVYLFEIIGTRKNAVVEETYIINTPEGSKKAQEISKTEFESMGNTFVRFQLLKVLDGLFMTILYILSNYSMGYGELDDNLEEAEFYDPFERDPHILESMGQQGYIRFDGSLYEITEKGRLLNELTYPLKDVKA
jgi:hypothetical protein